MSTTTNTLARVLGSAWHVNATTFYSTLETLFGADTVTTPGVAEASKALVVDANKHIDVLNVTASGLRIGTSGSETAVTSTAAELNTTAGVTAGTVIASKAMVTDSGIKISGLLNCTYGAGTATVAPINFTTGVNLTAAVAGAVEYDGTCFYATAATSSRQVLHAVQLATVGATPVALTNSITSAQSIFAAANDVLQLAASTTYLFECYLNVGTGATTHTTALGFVASSAFTSINYWAELWSTTSGSISTTAPSVLDVAASTATVLNATSTATTTIIRVKGMIRTNAASTVTPQITFSAGPTGTCQVNTNSFFRIWPIGSNTVAAVGNWS